MWLCVRFGSLRDKVRGLLQSLLRQSLFQTIPTSSDFTTSTNSLLTILIRHCRYRSTPTPLLRLQRLLVARKNFCLSTNCRVGVSKIQLRFSGHIFSIFGIVSCLQSYSTTLCCPGHCQMELHQLRK